MKKALLLYNPKAGNRRIQGSLDFIANKVQQLGYQLTVFRSYAPGSIEQFIVDEVTQDDTDLIMISGGDGTVNGCINGMIRKKIDLPLLIFPLGTANDFANTANIPSNVTDALSLLETGEPRFVDIGRVNEKYFINVCNMGIFSGVSHNTDLTLKKNLGKLAYYVKGIEELQNYESMDLEIEYVVDEQPRLLQGHYVLVLIFNGQGAGGFNRIAKDASIEDGYFDLIAIKDVARYEIPRLFVQVLQGEHVSNPNVDYLKCSKLTINCLNDSNQFVTDVDGEMGPKFPLNVSVVPYRIKVFLPKTSTLQGRISLKSQDDFFKLITQFQNKNQL
ncbi:MAG: lipid kinase [Epulopiscium sp. Nele67-Bin001]|nr:MAG: lipid kinase [Epulopiscium sp. Nuni2H_MBin001]OON90492.1 MAG: lipid kinase [Epulopiscium sp. Nele67-Bin001]